MHRRLRMLLGAGITVGLLVSPVLAGDPKALFNREVHYFSLEMPPPLNAPFIRAEAKRMAMQARQQSMSHHLVVEGGKVAADRGHVAINSVVVPPGEKLPSSLRQISIIGGRTADITVLGGR